MSAPSDERPRLAPALPVDAHKGTAGRLLVLAGCAEMPGASILVVRAAHRAGAGRVTLGCLDREMLSVVPVASPETVLLDLSREALAETPGDVPGIPTSPAFHARVVGPGLGDGDRTRRLVARSLTAPGPQVVDADALNALDGEPERLAAARGNGSGRPTVITPHAGEASRLLGRDVPRDREGRADAARELALRTGGLCVLKGAGTVVTDGERTFVNATGNPGMATAGAGDVLAGILGAYLAAAAANGSLAERGGFDAFAAVVAGVHVHGLAGDLAAEKLGRRALVAGDLVDFLPAAQRVLEGSDRGAPGT